MNTDIFARFPAYDEQQLEAAIDQKNPAIRLYGRRFYKDQTPVEAFADGDALDELAEGVSHAAADDDGVGLFEQAIDDLDLVVHFRATSG